MRDPIGFQRQGHALYGPLFSARVFGSTLVFVDPVGAPELFEQVMSAPRSRLSLVEAYKHLIGRIIGPELFVDLDKAMREGLSVKYIGRHLAATAECVPQVLARRLSGEGGTLDALRFANDAVLHVTAHYVLGRAAAERHGEELAEALHVLESDFSLLGLMLPIETPSVRRRTAAFDRLLELVEGEVRCRLDENGRHDDLLQLAIDRAESSHDVHALALRMLGVIFGAHTNTAMSLAATLMDLIEHPDDLARVHDEIAALPADAPLDLQTLRTLVHLHRSITETLRLRSNGGIWRMVMSDMTLGGHRLAAGSMIGSSMGLVDLDPRRYLESHEYRPSRYASMNTDRYQSPSVGSTPLEFGAFGTGRSLCTGRPLAYTILALMLVPLLRDYEWSLISKPVRWFTVLTGGLARPIGPLTLRYHRRSCAVHS